MKYIYIGKIVNTHGVRGEVRLISDFKYKDKVFRNGMNIYIGKNKDKEIINTYRPHKQFDMITMNGYSNINEILKYKGLNVYIIEEDLNLNKDEYLDEELIGLNVICDGVNYGKIKEITGIKTNKLIVVNNQLKDYLIPYNSDIIESIKFKEGNILIKSEIKGLFEI